jgi:hypothetical protein
VLDPWAAVLAEAVAADDGRVPRSARVLCEDLGITGVSVDTVSSYVRGLRRVRRAQRARMTRDETLTSR